MQETWETGAQFPGWEDPLDEGRTTHSRILAWRIPQTEETGRLCPIGSQRVRHDWNDLAHTHTLRHTHAHTHTLHGGNLLSACLPCFHSPALRNSFLVPLSQPSASLLKLPGAAHGLTSPLPLAFIFKPWESLESGQKNQRKPGTSVKQSQLIKENLDTFHQMVPEYFISKLKIKPCRLLELFEGTELEIPIKRKWLTVIDLSWLSWLPEEREEVQTQHTFSCLFSETLNLLSIP